VTGPERAATFSVARNPASQLAYLVLLPRADGPLVLKAADSWPRTAKVYCHRADNWPERPEIVDQAPVRSCVRRGAAIDLVLDRPRHNDIAFAVDTPTTSECWISGRGPGFLTAAVPPPWGPPPRIAGTATGPRDLVERSVAATLALALATSPSSPSGTARATSLSRPVPDSGPGAPALLALPGGAVWDYDGSQILPSTDPGASLTTRAGGHTLP
jgi:hypothetical protein